MRALIFTAWSLAQLTTVGGLVWPNLIGLLVIGAAAWKSDPLASPDGRRVVRLCLIPSIATIAMLAYAGAMYGSVASAPEIHWPLHALWGFLAAQAAASAVCIYKARRFRWFAMSVLAFEAWPALLAAFLASMALTDSWL